jgi:hypothetical protein
MLKELVQSLKPKKYLPKAFEKCSLCPIKREKALDRLPSIVESEEIAHHIDSALLKKLEVRRFGEASKKKPRGKKTPARQSHTQRLPGTARRRWTMWRRKMMRRIRSRGTWMWRRR